MLCHSEVIITNAKLHSKKAEFRFCAGSNPARGVPKVCDGKNLQPWSQIEMRLSNALSLVNKSTKQFIKREQWQTHKKKLAKEQQSSCEGITKKPFILTLNINPSFPAPIKQKNWWTNFFTSLFNTSKLTLVSRTPSQTSKMKLSGENRERLLAIIDI